jgi:hypothetical protein
MIIKQTCLPISLHTTLETIFISPQHVETLRDFANCIENSTFKLLNSKNQQH